MSLRLVSSAKNLRDQFKGNSNNPTDSSGASVTTATGGSKSILSRQGGTLHSSASNGNLRRSKSTQKKTLIAKVFTDESEQQQSMADLSMDLTLLIVRRCVHEIRERGK